MSLLEAAAPFDNRMDEAARTGGTEDASAFLGRMMASAQTGFQGWGECFHRFWLAEEESHTWAMVPEPQQKVLLDTTIPGCAYEIGATSVSTLFWGRVDGVKLHGSTRRFRSHRLDRRRARRVVDAGPRGARARGHEAPCSVGAPRCRIAALSVWATRGA